VRSAHDFVQPAVLQLHDCVQAGHVLHAVHEAQLGQQAAGAGVGEGVGAGRTGGAAHAASWLTKDVRVDVTEAKPVSVATENPPSAPQPNSWVTEVPAFTLILAEHETSTVMFVESSLHESATVSLRMYWPDASGMNDGIGVCAPRRDSCPTRELQGFLTKSHS
jgi:hypothetical protein